MELDALSLARLQFAFTVSFHIIFPAFTIGLASYLAVLEALWLATGRNVFLALFNYWKKIFAVTFGMGVVSGIVMSYQFGTNWSVFSDKTGPILGPLMGYEVLTAFFLEAGFLGVMLFGMERVGKRLHFFATLMVAAGTLMSAFWILAANSWMHTPAGYAVNAAGQFVADRLVGRDLQPVVSLPAGAHGARRLPDDRVRGRRGGRLPSARRPRQRGRTRDVLDGHVDGRHRRADPGGGGRPARPQHAGASAGQDRRHRGALGDGRGQPLILFGWPDMAAETTRYAIEIPKLGSFILTHDWNGTVKGLKDWPAQRAAELDADLLDLPHHGRASAC